MFECASGFKPAAVTATPNFSDDGIVGVLNRMFHEAIGEVATDDHNAENIATQIGTFVRRPGRASRPKPSRSRRNSSGRPPSTCRSCCPRCRTLRATCGMRYRACTPRRLNEVNYSIDGSSQAGTNGPITVGPGGLQGGDNTGPGIQGGNGTGSTSQGGGSTSSGGTGSGSPSPSASPTPAPQQHVYYDNYGATTQGVPMCRGNQGNPRRRPAVRSPRRSPRTQRHDQLYEGTDRTRQHRHRCRRAQHQRNGYGQQQRTCQRRCRFHLSQVAVKAGDTVSLRISFTATYGKIITVYQVRENWWNLQRLPLLPRRKPIFTRTYTGLRAVVSGHGSLT